MRDETKSLDRLEREKALLSTAGQSVVFTLLFAINYMFTCFTLTFCVINERLDLSRPFIISFLFFCYFLKENLFFLFFLNIFFTSIHFSVFSIKF